MSAIRGQLYNPSHNSQRWDIVLLGAFIHNSCLSLRELTQRCKKVVSWALCSREQYTLLVGLTYLVSVASLEHFNFSYRRTSDPYLISMAAKKYF